MGPGDSKLLCGPTTIIKGKEGPSFPSIRDVIEREERGLEKCKAFLVYPLASCLPWCYACYSNTYFPSSRVWLVLAKLASPQVQKSWMPVMTLILFLPFQLCTFLALFLPFLSHLFFPSIIVVGPHRSLLSPGPILSNLIFLLLLIIFVAYCIECVC